MGSSSPRFATALVAALALVGAMLSPVSADAAVDTVFGPDGTHYPSATPDIRSGFAGLTVIDVPASSTAIRSALDSLTATQIDGGAVIRVASGDIPTMTALNGYSNTRATKVLITARDGFESVTGSIGWRFTDVRGIAVMRFDLAEIDVKGATHCSFAWLRLSNHYFGAAASHGIPVHDVEFLELVEPAAVLKSSDSAQIKAYAPDSLTDVTIAGSYVAPSFYLDAAYGTGNPRPHTDSLQIEGDGIGASSVTIRDTAIFASNNSAVIIGGVPNVRFDHTLVVAGGSQALRFPFLAGGAGAPGALNGPGSQSAIQGSGGGGVTATDSTFIGSLQPVWADVATTVTDQRGKTAAVGAFTQDLSLAGWTAAALDAVSPAPTAEFLRGIWDRAKVGATSTPAPSPGTSTTTAPSIATVGATATEAATKAATKAATRPSAKAIAAAARAHATAVATTKTSIAHAKRVIRTTRSPAVRAHARHRLTILRHRAAIIARDWRRLVSRYS